MGESGLSGQFLWGSDFPFLDPQNAALPSSTPSGFPWACIQDRVLRGNAERILRLG